MTNLEIIDDYLSNRLPEADKAAFEQQLAGDPALQQELQVQKEIIEAVRQARAMELKNMLKNVPVSGNSWSGGKIAAVISAGVIATSLYFYFQTNEQPEPATTPQEEVVQPSNNTPEITAPSNEEKKEEATTVVASEKPKSDKKEIAKPVTPANKPDIQVVDPSAEFEETKEPTETATSAREEISNSKMEVLIDSSDKKYNFHYQFAEGKLNLFGPFDKSLYEILEIHGDGHAVFLFYKENYYLLDEQQSVITKLAPIRDGQLLRKLKEYRGR